MKSFGPALVFYTQCRINRQYVRSVYSRPNCTPKKVSLVWDKRYGRFGSAVRVSE